MSQLDLNTDKTIWATPDQYQQILVAHQTENAELLKEVLSAMVLENRVSHPEWISKLGREAAPTFRVVVGDRP